MNKPVSPCTKDCPDRGALCTRTCTHGYAEYEKAKFAYYQQKYEEMEKRGITQSYYKKSHQRKRVKDLK